MGGLGRTDGQERPEIVSLNLPFALQQHDFIRFILLKFCTETFTSEIHVDGTVSKTTVRKMCATCK